MRDAIVELRRAGFELEWRRAQTEDEFSSELSAGADVVLAHPEGYHLMPDTMEFAHAAAKASGGSFKVVHSMDEAFKDADIVYPKSWGIESLFHNPSEALEISKKYRNWICDERRMKLANPRAIYMHCLPADIGAEVSPGVMERYKLDVARQAQKKVYAIMAVLAAAKVGDLAARLASA